VVEPARSRWVKNTFIEFLCTIGLGYQNTADDWRFKVSKEPLVNKGYHNGITLILIPLCDIVECNWFRFKLQQSLNVEIKSKRNSLTLILFWFLIQIYKVTAQVAIMDVK
jgi:hypothetical protein